MAVSTYWWRSRNGGYNLGDELTPILLRGLFDVDPELKPMAQAKIAGAGSILGWAWSMPGAVDNTRSERLSIVGSGLMKPETGLGALDCLALHSVRGYLSKSLLPVGMVQETSVGDPGLLVSLLPHKRSAPSARIGVIPHVGSIDRPHFVGRLADLPDHRIIDFRTQDLATTMSQMLDCEIILSQSLHGLIIADALGLPNTWLNFGDLHPGGMFKFYDYFSSVRRPFDLGVQPDESLTYSLAEANLFEISDRVLRSIQSNIVDAFMEALTLAR